MDTEREQRARMAAFLRLEQLEDLYGEALPASALRQGFFFENHWIPLTGQSGIWRPRQLSVPLSIRTSVDDPYRDELGTDRLSYAYRSRGLTRDQALRHAHNEGLREAMRTRLPLVYFHPVGAREYQALRPIWIVGDARTALRFDVVFAERAMNDQEALLQVPDEVERRYAMRQAKVRLHQNHFRSVVLRAYDTTCTVCRLRGFRELLDASHIRADAAEGRPNVRNGLSLCQIHHTAFDRDILGIRPDYVVEVNRRVLEEHDGPMLRHGLQERHGEAILLPHRRAHHPDPDLLEQRYEAFRQAG